MVSRPGVLGVDRHPAHGVGDGHGRVLAVSVVVMTGRPVIVRVLRRGAPGVRMDVAVGVGLEGVQAVLGAEVEGLARRTPVTALPRSTFMPQTGSVAPRRAVSQNSAAKTARPARLRKSL